jgi:hypothetical protein
MKLVAMVGSLSKEASKKKKKKKKEAINTKKKPHLSKEKDWTISNATRKEKIRFDAVKDQHNGKRMSSIEYYYRPWAIYPTQAVC